MYVPVPLKVTMQNDLVSTRSLNKVIKLRFSENIIIQSLSNSKRSEYKKSWLEM